MPTLPYVLCISCSLFARFSARAALAPAMPAVDMLGAPEKKKNCQTKVNKTLPEHQAKQEESTERMRTRTAVFSKRYCAGGAAKKRTLAHKSTQIYSKLSNHNERNITGNCAKRQTICDTFEEQRATLKGPAKAVNIIR